MASQRLGRWETAAPLEESGRPAYVHVARLLGANWGMWLGLVAAVITFWLPWWHWADPKLGTNGIQAFDLYAPGYYLASLALLVAILAVIYLVLADSRINAFYFSFGDAWVALGAVVSLSPFALTNSGRVHNRAKGDRCE